MTGSLFGASSVRPQQLRCEYRVNPQGIDVIDPRLSWVLTPVNPKVRGLSQSAYRILVSASEAGLRGNTGDLWDSGKIASSDSTQVVYGGKPLNSSVAAFWKVQVWDQDGQPGDWSVPAQWTMGLLRAEDWKGKWIGRDEAGAYKDSGSVYQALERARWIWDTANAQTAAPLGDRFFRAAFTVPAGRKVTRAISVIGADNTSDVYLNGEQIAVEQAALARAGRHHAPAASRRNVIAVRASHTQADGPAGLIGAVRSNSLRESRSCSRPRTSGAPSSNRADGKAWLSGRGLAGRKTSARSAWLLDRGRLAAGTGCPRGSCAGNSPSRRSFVAPACIIPASDSPSCT